MSILERLEPLEKVCCLNDEFLDVWHDPVDVLDEAQGAAGLDGPRRDGSTATGNDAERVTYQVRNGKQPPSLLVRRSNGI